MAIKDEILNNVMNTVNILSEDNLIKFRDMIIKWTDEHTREYYYIDGICRIGLLETHNDVCKNKEIIDALAHKLYDEYNDIIDNSKNLTDMVRNAFKKYGWKLSLTEKNEIKEYDEFNFELFIGQIISRDDMGTVLEMMNKKCDINVLKDYIKKSKTNGLIRIFDYRLDYISDNIRIDSPIGIYDYNMVVNALKEFGLNVVLRKKSESNEQDYEYIYDPSYDDILDCILKSKFHTIIIYDNRLSITDDGYTKINKAKQKVLSLNE